MTFKSPGHICHNIPLLHIHQHEIEIEIVGCAKLQGKISLQRGDIITLVDGHSVTLKFLL